MKYKLQIFAIPFLLFNFSLQEKFVESTLNKCELIPDRGFCRAVFKRYYYDKKDKKCKAFIWGGCGGIVPFNTLEECKKNCGCD